MIESNIIFLLKIISYMLYLYQLENNAEMRLIWEQQK